MSALNTFAVRPFCFGIAGLIFKRLNCGHILFFSLILASLLLNILIADDSI